MNISDLITSGGDERIRLKENGKNKYYVNPADYAGFVSRSSCTCSPLNPETEEVVSQFTNGLSTEEFLSFRSAQEARLKKLVNYRGKDKFELFLSPSGSDLSYYPLLFASLMAKGKDIVSLITRPEELGKGSINASKGLFFGEENQFAEKVEKGQPLNPHLNIEYIPFPSFNPEGLVYDHRDELIAQINSIPEEKFIICSLVVGSKTGTIDNIDLIKEVKRDILWIVDICQFRVSRRLINQLLDMGCLVMITGSKFYQAPPFCGGMLVPKDLVSKFKEENLNYIEGFDRVFSKHDIPSSQTWLREQFKDYQNLGLLARWEAALYEIEQLNSYKVHTILKQARKWNRAVTKELGKNPEVFDIMPETNRTNWSIVSFQVKDQSGNFVKGDDLEAFYQQVIATPIAKLDNKKALIGQPVHIGDQSYIRMALGSYNLRRLIETPENINQDKAIIENILKLAKELN